jgi:hypothetical protein
VVREHRRVPGHAATPGHRRLQHRHRPPAGTQRRHRPDPAEIPAELLIRIDGAGATHDLLEHLHQLNTRWRTVAFTVGWAITDTDEQAITDTDEQAIAALPESAWSPSLRQDGQAADTAAVAELTGLNPRAGWIPACDSSCAGPARPADTTPR